MRVLTKYTISFWRADKKTECLIANSVFNGPVAIEKR